MDDGTVLILPPARLSDLPPSGRVSLYRGLPALRYDTTLGGVVVFLHDLHPDDVAEVLDAQRHQAEVQLGKGYDRRAFWWEAKP